MEPSFTVSIPRGDPHPSQHERAPSMPLQNGIIKSQSSSVFPGAVRPVSLERTVRYEQAQSMGGAQKKKKNEREKGISEKQWFI